MSQLYKLFCDGLKSRSERDGLSSTLIVTSTPLEENEDEVNPNCEANGNNNANNNNNNLSVEPQVGSAEPESPPVDGIPAHNVINEQNELNVLNQVCPAIQRHTKNGDSSRSSDASAGKGCADDPAGPTEEESASPQKSRVGNVSPVDFVDRLIAVKRRDEALNKKQKADSSSSERPPPSKDRIVESSETDFEGAEEYFQQNPTHRTTSHSKSNASKGTPSREKSDDEYNFVLSMPQISESSSSSPSSSSSIDIENMSQHGPESFSAARCRVYQKKPSENQDIENERRKRSLQDVSNQSHTSHQEAQMESKGKNYGKSVDSNSKFSSILRGVVAYVEVRSGHDNRSMGIRSQLRKLGAIVLEKFGKEVTHVVFNEGSPSTLQRAQNQGCHIVSVLWIEESKVLGKPAPESEHPPFNMHLYSHPQVRSKYRKLKSYQPDFEEGESEERLNQYIKKNRRKVCRISPQTNDCGASAKESSNSDDEAEASVPKAPQTGCILPDGVILRPLSIVLNKINNEEATESSPFSTEKRNGKRRLMPLQTQVLDSVSLEDFNPTDLLRPKCPYSEASSKQKPTTHQTSITGRAPSVTQNRNRPRRSSCFTRGRQGFMGSQYRQKKVKPQMRTMVCTFMHRRDIDVVAAVLKQLGGWILEPTVSHRTTHVVCGDEKRTLNLLRGIANGCWILHQEWVMRSLEIGHWLDEEPFELSMFPAIQQCRVARETLGVRPDIFSAVGAIFVAKETTPPRQAVQELLELCGAQVVKVARQAKLIIGQYQRRSSHSDVIHVNEQWVLDSIQENMLQPYRHYRLK